MNAKQEAKFTMYRTIEKHCEDNPAITGTVPAFQTTFNEFKTKIAEIGGITQFSGLATTGITTDKTSRKKTLARMAADIAGIIYAYASATKNDALKAEVNYNFTKLLGTRDDQLAPRCQNIHAKAAENLADLKDYGIAQAKLDQLQTAIDDYKSATPKPRTAVSQRKTLNTNLRRLLKEADEILKERMDKLVANFKTDHPDFVAQYESNRIIIDPATTTTQLKGKVTAQSDGAPVKNAAVTIVEAGLTAKTDSAGEYLIKPAPAGKYTVRVTATGFQDFEQDEVEVKLGDVNKLEIKLSNN